MRMPILIVAMLLFHSRCFCSPLGMPIHWHPIESHFINQQTHTIRKTSSNKLMFHGFFLCIAAWMVWVSSILLLFSHFDFSQSFGVEQETIKWEREREWVWREKKILNRKLWENENRENFGKPIVKFPCECFIVDNQQILISKMKRNTYLVNVSMCIWHLFGYFMDEDSDCYSISAASNANKISSKS